eukprot:CAMPEP_0178992854 /NCGR_PEP_ID=MMETSP0795-20121207/6358_1 /TAXON_ID=88552 /ORGANISM="Amoebophrya sp., Strain Ameob2" /LENGTH=557 /DNA_ID=CAMNT_0020684807 /DNA_START=282 /DNA_END=1955 /DNA_ORIENTATION=+
MFLMVPAPSGASSALERSIAHRLCQFTTQLVNKDLEYLFTEFLPHFDVSEDLNSADMKSGRGETLEQYACFQKYTGLLEQHLTLFAQRNGYTDAAVLVQELQQAIEEDKARVSADFEQFLADYRNQVRCQFGYSSAKNNKRGNNSAGEQGEGEQQDPEVGAVDSDLEEEVGLMRMLFKPQTAEDLFEAVLNMFEYPFFANLMRERVRQKRLEQKAKLALQSVEDRRRAVLDGEFGLAFRFVEFAVELLNDRLDAFYHKHVPLFDHTAMSQHDTGAEQSHAQFAAFQEYEQIVERELAEFSRKENMEKPEDLFSALQELMKKDEQKAIDARLEEEMGTLAEDQWRRFGTVEELVAGVLDQCEYAAFADMMALRAQEERLLGLFFRSEDFANEQSGGPPASPTYAYGGVTAGNKLDVLGLAPPPAPPPVPVAASMQLLVPDGCGGGSSVNFITPDGQNLSTMVPDGLGPGMEFSVQYAPLLSSTSSTAGADNLSSIPQGELVIDPEDPQMRRLSVTVPDGCEAGSSVTVQTPEGQQLTVEVPPGVGPGMLFEVNYHTEV